VVPNQLAAEQQLTNRPPEIPKQLGLAHPRDSLRELRKKPLAMEQKQLAGLVEA
jgi:hypothetical protein